MKKLFALFLLTSATLAASAKSKVDDGVLLQNVEVAREKTVFTVTYDISLGKDLMSCNICLMLSTDAGLTFSTVEKSRLSGDVGKISASGSKTIRYDFSQDVEKLAGKQLAFKVEVSGKDVLKREMLVGAQVAVYPHLSYGFMFAMVKKWGWYVKAGSDFRFPSSSYECSMLSRDSFWGTGKSQISRLNITGGAMVRAVKWLYPYLGLGYGSYGLYWEDAAGNWAKVSDYSTKGLSLDGGLAFKFGKVAVALGASNTMFKYTEAVVGVGVMF